ncbi:MAG: flagellar motor protein MotB [Caulobacter sp.]|jgi:chemotaxis protein MotB
MAIGGDRPILIKKVKKVAGHGHHGGAWKVAYADFVTAMMAFFLLMWLINTTSPEQKRGIADYFAPASVSETTSGSGGILGGTALGDDGAKSNGSMDIVENQNPESKPTERSEDQSLGAASLEQASEEALREELERRETDQFASAAQSLRQALQDMPELAELSKQIMIDVTPEGLRIQLIDQDGRSMFKEGSSQPNDRARILLRAVARVINSLPNRISISGHTSANADGSRASGDWALSAARADSARQILQASGVDPDRIYQVSGKANSEPLYLDDPTLAGNRRITIILLREAPVLPPRD